MSMTDFEPGVVIDGRYRIRSRVGAGGMADVYLAEDEQLGRDVALKLLHRRFAQDPGFVERFRREAHAAASLQHPNVVSVFDRGAFDGTYYIAMEYLPGRSLKQLIRDEAPVEPVRAIDLTLQILQAAKFAHRRGVIHRDLKPHNVIVDDSDHVKVTDFGIARAGASDMTETGSIMGTAQYLSPEQAQGLAVSAPSDLYSIGVILYELLTGRLPFDGESPVAIALKHVSQAPTPLSEINPAVPPELEQVVLWTLNKSPGDRPADADQLIDALTQVRTALVGGSTASMRTLPRRVGPVVAPAAAAEAYEAVQRPPSGERYEGYDDDRDGDGRRPVWPWIVAILVLLAIAGGVLAFLLTRPVKVSVPPVTGLALPQAETRLQAVGLKPDPHNQTDRQPAGTVIGQNPLSRVSVNRGSSVTLFVSSGPGRVTIQPVVGLSQAAAVKLLERAGLKVARVVRENSTTVKRGDATKTDPPAGQAVERGSDVVLYVSLGKPRPRHHAPARFRVPYVVGESLAAAENALLPNFSVTVNHATTSSAPPGTVLQQSPDANTMLRRNATVTLTVAKAPGRIPSVTGFTASAAISTLRAAGYAVARSYRSVNNPSLNGIVISQSPGGGATGEPGTAVTIVIGKYVRQQQTTTTPQTTGTTNTGATTNVPAPGGAGRP